MRNTWFWFLVMCAGMLYSARHGYVVLTLIDIALAIMLARGFGQYDIPDDNRSLTNDGR